MKAQPPLWMRPLSSVLETSSSESVAVAPQITKAMVSTAETPNTTRSVVGRLTVVRIGGQIGRYRQIPPLPTRSLLIV